MCEPTTLLAASTAMSVVSGVSDIFAGRAEGRGYEARAIQFEAERQDTETSFSQQQRDRHQQFRDQEEANELAIAISGLAPESFSASMSENRKRAADDMRRIAMQGEIEQGRIRTAIADSRDAAKQARRGGLLKGLMTIGNAGISLGQNAPGLARSGGSGGGSKRTSSSLVKLR